MRRKWSDKQLDLDFGFDETDDDYFEAKASLPVYSPLYCCLYNTPVIHCYKLDQDYNCHNFIQKYSYNKKRWIGGWI